MAGKRGGSTAGAFSRLGILAKLLLLGAVTLVAFAIVFVVANSGLSRLSRSVSELQQLQGGLVSKAASLEARAYEAQLFLYRAAMASIRGQGPAMADAIAQLQIAIGVARDAISDIKSDEGAYSVDVKSVAAVVKAFDSWIILISDPTGDLSIDHERTEAFVATADARFSTFKTAVDGLKSAIAAIGSAHDAAARRLSRSSSFELTGVIAAAILLIAILTILTVRSIRVPLGRLELLLDRMGTGDLAGSFDAGGRNDEISRMGRSVDRLASNLRALVGTIKQRVATLEDTGQRLSSTMEETGSSVLEINSSISMTKGQLAEQSKAVGEVSEAIEGLARGIEALTRMIGEQSGVISHSSAAVEEMIANIESVASNSERVEAESKRNLTESAEGKALIDGVSESVSSIVRYAENLGEATRVIKEVADRTGLLAMNAAIEAAHAGDSGRGFAVVADEIRKLAEQSTEQAKDISRDLGRVAEAIQSVQAAAEAAVAAFAAILDRAKDVGDSVRQISGAMVEQRQGGHQVLEALGQLRDITRDIGQGSDGMSRGNSAILGQMERLRQVNDVVVQNNEEITRGTLAINDAIGATIGLSALTSNLIAEVRDSADHFALGDSVPPQGSSTPPPGT